MCRFREHTPVADYELENSTVGILYIAPIERKIVIGVNQRVQKKLNSKECYHQNAKHWRAFFHRVVVLKDKPLRPDSYCSCNNHQHEAYSDIYFGIHFLIFAEVVLATAEKLYTVSAHNLILNLYKETNINLSAIDDELIPPFTVLYPRFYWKLLKYKQYLSYLILFLATEVVHQTQIILFVFTLRESQRYPWIIYDLQLLFH